MFFLLPEEVIVEVLEDKSYDKTCRETEHNTLNTDPGVENVGYWHLY
jgi:hypothetical protein